MRRLQSATLPPPVFAQQKPPLRPTVAGVQELILDKDGSVLSSDDALFPIQKTIGEKPVFEWLPFLESVWPTLFSPDFLSKPHRFKAVQTALPELSGIYDFVFAATDFEKTPALRWTIEERTPYYIGLRRRQQRAAEIRLARERAR